MFLCALGVAVYPELFNVCPVNLKHRTSAYPLKCVCCNSFRTFAMKSWSCPEQGVTVVYVRQAISASSWFTGWVLNAETGPERWRSVAAAQATIQTSPPYRRN